MLVQCQLALHKQQHPKGTRTKMWQAQIVEGCYEM
jgi:hypothetical protein